MRRIALEKLAAHLTGMLIVMAVVALTTWLAGAAFGTLPGDEIAPVAAIGFALWVGLVALASGAVAFALAPLVGRGASAGIAGAVLIGGYFLNGYQASVPAFAGLADLTWFGWTVHHQPLIGQPDWASLVLVAVATTVLLAIGVVLFSRRDVGATSRIPWPGFPEATLGLGGPSARAFGERLPLAIAWGAGVGIFAFVLGAAARSFGEEMAKISPSTLEIFKAIFPNIDLTAGAGAFLQLVFVEFGFILAGFAAATLVSGWASDETGGRLEMLLTTPLARMRWAVTGGFGVFGAIAVFTGLLAVGHRSRGLDRRRRHRHAHPRDGRAGALCRRTGRRGPGRRWPVADLDRRRGGGRGRHPDLRHQPRRTGAQAARLGLPAGADRAPWTADGRDVGLGGMAACVVLALGGLALGGWGARRRDIAA